MATNKSALSRLSLLIASFLAVYVFVMLFVYSEYIAVTFRLLRERSYGEDANERQRDSLVLNMTTQIVDFEGFNNENATENQTMIVPNIVHLIYMDKNKLRFHEMICLYSIFLNQKPDAIVIHCENCTFIGRYWHEIENVTQLRRIIHFNKLPVRRRIFGKAGHWPVHHRSDYWRNLILMEYGGMYFDNDVYVVNSLDYYRKFEMSVGMENAHTWVMGSQVLIAHKNARLLKAWFDSYRSNYKKNEWYTNAGHVPGKVIKKHRYIAHVEATRFGVYIGTHHLYQEYFREWKKKFDTWHLLINHRDYLDKANYKKYPEFNAINVWMHNVTFCVMARDALTRIAQVETKNFTNTRFIYAI